MPAPETLLNLVQTFQQHHAAYHKGDYNETQLRREFLDPFFEALGWDVFNKQGYAPAYKDVIHEDAIKIGGATKAPDYAFRIGGTRKFFVEAKKPAVNVLGGVNPAYQLRRYAWSAKLPLSILTDFEEFAVYDCRSKPAPDDKASTGRVLYLSYSEYAGKWDEIAAIFSREAVLKGSFDQYAESTRGKHGTAEVDDAFLAEIERWRDLLARNIALRNPQLSQRQLNYAVQMTIDRMIFLRICEDRGIEPYGQLQALLNGGETYARLGQLFRKADGRYNSGLFHFHSEKGQAGDPDGLSLGLLIDDKPLKDILGSVYYPASPYEFSVLPADILGQVYEQFLGKVIRLTEGHRAVVEDKPEVKKAGGVFYTPTYIVEYIVRQAIGTQLQDRKPGEKGLGGKGEPFRVLDPACGSGSFLLGAYQYLLDWYRDGYIAGGAEKWAKGRAPALYQSSGGEWKLTTGERKRILLDHIYGVDIDPQAVEVTKLSLLLKVLEGESEQSLARQLSLWQERALPDLGQNIKCGNSLIGPDFYSRGGQQMGLGLFDDEEIYRINAFDWQAEFPAVFQGAGGFDAVIGNPPYIRIQALKEWAPREVEFYKQRYAAASKGNYDIYVVFVEKGLGLLNPGGRLGYILPHKFFNAQYGQPLRQLLAAGKHLAKVVHFGDQQVFENATTYTCLMFLDKAGSEQFEFEKVDNLREWREARIASTTRDILTSSVSTTEWNFTVGKDAGLFERLSQMPVKLGNVAVKIFQGLVTSSDPVYLLDPIGVEQNGVVRVRSKATGKEYELEMGVAWPLCKGSRDISRYIAIPSKRVLFPYDSEESAKSGKTVLISKGDFERKYPRAWKYLQENFDTLRNRENGKMRHDGWYGYVYPKSVSLFAQPKILTPSIASKASYTFDANGELYFVGSGGGGGGGYGIILNKDYENKYGFILGLLNSRLLDYYLQKISSPFRGGYFAYNRQYIEQIPIVSGVTESPEAQKISSLTERMLTLQRQLAAAATPTEKTVLQRQVEATDAQIDALVYALYGLTEEEISVVEGKSGT